MPLQLMLRCAAMTIAAAALYGCDREDGPASSLGPLEVLTTPAGPGSTEPNLAVGPDGRAYLSWLQPAGADSFGLYFATLDAGGWSAPRTIATGADWFVNWADFPAIAVLPDGRLAAHYLRRPPRTIPGTYYDIHVVQSSDGGETWSAPVTPHRDGSPAEHGFVSLFPAAGDSLGIVWLDGRKFTDEFGATDETSLRYAALAADGGMSPDISIDERSCECCPTSVAITAGGPIVAYRDRSDGEIRDIYVTRLEAGRWTEGSPVHQDGWEINGCPVNGPAISSDGRQRIVVAWFTGARDTARVKVAFSEDGGLTFGLATIVDGGNPAGRVDVELLADGSALVSWMERGAGNSADVLVRRVTSDGARSEPLLVTASSGAPASGFPRMVVAGDAAIFAWTEPAAPSQVYTARTELQPILK
jgi:hypothetical protein